MEVGGNGSEFLRIGTSSVPAQWFVPTILSGFLKKNVNTQVEMTSADSLDIIRRVKEGSLDIGFVGTKVEKQCKYIPLIKDHLVLAAPNTKEYQKIFAGESDSGESDLRQILEAPFLARRQYSGTMKEALGSLKYFGIEEMCIRDRPWSNEKNQQSFFLFRKQCGKRQESQYVYRVKHCQQSSWRVQLLQ